MSAFSRAILAISFVLFAVLMAFLPVAEPTPQQRFVQWTIISFLLLLAISCFVRPVRAIVSRVVGVMVFALCVEYIRSQWGKPLGPGWHRRSETNIVNAVIAFCTFGVPGAYVAVKGRFPKWTVLGDRLHRNAK